MAELQAARETCNLQKLGLGHLELRGLSRDWRLPCLQQALGDVLEAPRHQKTTELNQWPCME